MTSDAPTINSGTKQSFQRSKITDHDFVTLFHNYLSTPNADLQHEESSAYLKDELTATNAALATKETSASSFQATYITEVFHSTAC